MTAPLESRKKILDRIRAATQSTAENRSSMKGTGFSPYIDKPQESGALAPEGFSSQTLPRAYIRHGQLSAEARIELMIERLREYDAEVVESMPLALPATIAAQLALSGRHTFVAPQGLPAEWIAAGFDWKIDHSLATAEIEQAEGAVTASYCGIADSGTIVLHHSPAEGRRVLTLLPDWHLCILRASQVVETLPEYFNRCQQPPALATWISGPSATADIEMTRIKGVHGPRFLHVILVRDE
jgi:L-lactate dehydrogenase complex protein LldG